MAHWSLGNLADRWHPLARLGLDSQLVRRHLFVPYAREEAAIASHSMDRRVGVHNATRPPVAIPAQGQLDYYRARHQDFLARHPGMQAPSYYLGYGSKYAQRFSTRLAPRLSPQGQEWMGRTRAALQAAIERHRTENPVAFDRLEQDDQAFTRFAYATHVNAYVTAGFQELPAGDLFKIIASLDRRDLVGALMSLSTIPVRRFGRRMLGHSADRPVTFPATWQRLRRALSFQSRAGGRSS